MVLHIAVVISVFLDTRPRTKYSEMRCSTLSYASLAAKAARLACTIVPIVLCNTVYYAVLMMMND